MELELIDNINNSWSDSQEKLLTKWHKEAIMLNWKHLRASRRYSFIDRMIGIPTVIANAITGTAIFLNLQTSSENSGNIIIQSIIGSIVILTAIFMGIQNFLRLAELGEKHNSSGIRYKNFANSIETELVLPKEDRLNGKIFIKQAQKRFNELIEMSPTIPLGIEKDYNKYIKSLSKIECNELTEIIINDSILKHDSNNNNDNNNDNNSIYGNAYGNNKKVRILEDSVKDIDINNGTEMTEGTERTERTELKEKTNGPERTGGTEITEGTESKDIMHSSDETNSSSLSSRTLDKNVSIGIMTTDTDNMTERDNLSQSIDDNKNHRLYSTYSPASGSVSAQRIRKHSMQSEIQEELEKMRTLNQVDKKYEDMLRTQQQYLNKNAAINKFINYF